jgi:hypothetical protein
VDESPYAPDGSPIALYATLPALGEPELVHGAVPAGSEILELGAGAGRITRGLVLADLEKLSLGRRFPVVLLASNFVNDPDRSRVRAYLDSCARHVLPNGQVLIQGYPRDWQPSSEWRDLGGVRLRLRSFELDGAQLRGEMEYVVAGQTLFHAFEALLATEAQIDADLEAAGLRRHRYLDDAGSWTEAVPRDGVATA